jgi:DNA polymerase-3 subunit epsilon
LCSRYAIDNSRRTKHGALLDAELLAEVYIELIGARQTLLSLTTASAVRSSGDHHQPVAVRARPEPLAPRVSAEEEAAHTEFVAKLGDNAIWRDYQPG